MVRARAVTRRGRVSLLLAAAVLVVALAAASRASANGLVWSDCGDGFQCSTFCWSSPTEDDRCSADFVFR